MKKLLSLALALAFSGTALAQQDPKPAPTDAPAPPPPPAKPADGGGDAPKPDDSSKAPQAAQKYSIAVLNFTFLEAVRENKDGVTQDYLKEFETSALTNKFVNS